MNNEEEKAELRQALEPIVAEFKRAPFLSILFALSLGFYVFGYVFNNLQNPNYLFTSSWFYDSVILSWTNLLVIPLLLIQAPWKLRGRDWSEFKLILKAHLISPLFWILGYLGIRLVYKFLLNLNVILASILNWLAS
jgi:hypothetical protein